jgi:FMN phosphatase YigB (HAD superfamily)
MDKVWVFDLEETVIQSWDNPVLCNVDRVRTFIKDNNIKDVHIFSAAIWNEQDKHHFEVKLKSFLENAFEINIVSWPSMEDAWKNSHWHGTFFEGVCELLTLIGKKRLFEDWCMWNALAGSHCVLLDDSFGNTVLTNYDTNIVIETVDVLKLRSTD